MSWPDIEKLLVAYLSGRLDGVPVCTELDPDFPVPVVQLAKVGGGEANYVLDHPSVDVTAYAATLAEAAELGARVRDLMLALPGTDLPVTRAAANPAPRRIPYDDPAKRRYGGTYDLTLAASDTH